MKKGYSFIELLISATIFATVLAMSFIALSTILRSARVSETNRSVAASGFEAVSSIETYARYASPLYTKDGNRPCQPNGTSVVREALYYGIHSSLPNRVSISIPGSALNPVSKVYLIEANQTANQDYLLYLTEFSANNINQSAADCGFTTTAVWPLLGVNTYVIPLENQPIFSVVQENPLTTGKVGEIDFNPASTGEAGTRLLRLQLQVIGKDAATGAVVQTQSFVTSITPRRYQSTFGQL